MPGLTVGAGLARGLMEFAVSKGANRALLAERSGIDPAALADQDNRIAFEKYVALMRAGKTLCHDPALGLHYGEANDMSQISVVGLIANASANMRDALVQLNRYGRLVVEFDGGPDRFAMVRDGAGLWTVDNRKNPNDFPELTESTLARMVCAPRHFGVTQLAKAVHVTHPAPAYVDEYQRIFRAPVIFASTRNAVLIDEKWLSHPVQLQPRYAFGVLSERAEALLQELENSKTLRGRVEALLMPILHTGNANIQTVSAQMGLSRQTMFRRLKAEGTSFEKLLDGLRHTLAMQYLGGKKVSINETAYLVGFSDPAAFSRAFKRWTGASPRSWLAAASVRKI